MLFLLMLCLCYIPILISTYVILMSTYVILVIISSYVILMFLLCYTYSTYATLNSTCVILM